jgi:hypothetical protein
MIKDILENLIKEIRNEKNQKQLTFVLEPVYNKLKFSYYLIVVLLLLMLINLVYISYRIKT